MRYRERPKVVEAKQLKGTQPDGTNVEELFAWMREGNTPGKGLPVELGFPVVKHTAGDDLLLAIYTPDQKWMARVGDWIIKHRNREFSVVKGEDFDILYEVVE